MLIAIFMRYLYSAVLTLSMGESKLAVTIKEGKMARRYRVGFENPEIKSGITERNPGFPAIVDTNSVFAFGAVVAICDNQDIAERIVDLLNSHATE